MLSLRRLAVSATRAHVATATRSVSALTPLEEGRQELEEEKSKVQRRVEAMTKVDPTMVFGITEPDAPPVLPDNPSEISALDSAHRINTILPDGRERMVVIRQDLWKPGQSPMNVEEKWMISFEDDGEHGECWDNPLMGWVSGSDPMSSNINLQMSFDNATEAVYFAKKRGWQFVVEYPVLRMPRDDAAQYQDNFLPQTVATKVRQEKTLCKHWERELSGASHYTRPLKYHGNGEVVQHGPNGTDAPAKHVPGYYKMR